MENFMKKFLSVLLCCILLFTCFAVSGCAKKNEGDLSYGKMYIISSDVNTDAEKEKTTYYVFNKNGTLTYHHYYKHEYGAIIQHYEVCYKYTYTKNQNTVFYFFDSIKYFEDDTYHTTPSERGILLVSKDAIMDSTATSIYVCEDFIGEIPNYNK